MNDWKPISTAPRDGQNIIVWRPDDPLNEARKAHAGLDCWSHDSWWHSRRNQQPTHWMPLPSAPAPTESGGRLWAR